MRRFIIQAIMPMLCGGVVAMPLVVPVLGQSNAADRQRKKLEQLEQALQVADKIKDDVKHGQAMSQIALQFAGLGRYERAEQVVKEIRDGTARRDVSVQIYRIVLRRTTAVSGPDQQAAEVLQLLDDGRVGPAMKIVDQVDDSRQRDFLLLNIVSAMTTNRLLGANLLLAERQDGKLAFPLERLLIAKPQYTAEAMERAGRFADQIKDPTHASFALSLVALAHLKARQVRHAQQVIARITDVAMKEDVQTQVASVLATGKVTPGAKGALTLSKSQAASVPTFEKLYREPAK